MEIGIIDDFHKWCEFHEAKNLISHTCNEEITEKVYVTAKKLDIYLKNLF